MPKINKFWTTQNPENSLKTRKFWKFEKLTLEIVRNLRRGFHIRAICTCYARIRDELTPYLVVVIPLIPKMTGSSAGSDYYYLGVGDFFGENRLAFASNGDFVRSSALATGEWDFSESALWLVDTDVGVCGNGSGNEGNPLSRCPWLAKLFWSEDWIGFGLERLSFICCNCWSCCCCWVAISWCCNNWWKAKVCCNICSFSFDCCCCAAWAPDEKPNWKLFKGSVLSRNCKKKGLILRVRKLENK